MTAKQLPIAETAHECCDHRRANGVDPCPDCHRPVDAEGQPISDETIARRDLAGLKCAACNGRKKAQESFCKRCYFSLPGPMRTLLYKTMLEGYATYYKNALDWLAQRKAEKKAGRA